MAKSKKRIVDAAYFGYLAGATDIVFHPGSYFGRPAKEVLTVVIPRLQEAVDEAARMGSKAILRVEVMGKSAMLGSLDDALTMSKAVPSVLPCIDFAHLHARAGNGSMNSAEEWSDVLEKYSVALGKNALEHLHIHLSGIEYTPKGKEIT